MHSFLEEYGSTMMVVLVCAVSGFVLHSLSLWIKLMENMMIGSLI